MRLQQDTDPAVRRAAAEVLGEFTKDRDPAVERALTKAAQEDELSVRLAARKSLAALEAYPSAEADKAVSNQAFETA